MRIPSLFGRQREAIPVVPEFYDLDGTAYAIGDVHGKIDLLKGIISRIRSDISRSDENETKTIVFMGDYVDRGEDSRGVLEFLARFDQDIEMDMPGCRVVFLRGNHEQQMLDFIDDPVGERRWLGWGGRETLASFGISEPFPTSPDEEFLRVGDALATKLGALRGFIEKRTDLWWRSGNVVFSHGGMDPHVPIEEQRSKTMLWGSQLFMERGGPPGFWHVHGHVIHAKPGIYGNRIAVDTGAYESGFLTAGRINRRGCAFVQQS